MVRTSMSHDWLYFAAEYPGTTERRFSRAVA